MTDGELIQAIRQGQSHAFDLLYQRHREAVFRYACALSGRIMDGEDLLQEAFLGMIRNIKSIRSTHSVLPYLLRSVRSRHIDQLRAFSNRAKAIGEQDFFSEDPHPESITMEGERLTILFNALAELSDVHRDAVLLKIYGGLSYSEIALLQEVPQATVRSRYRSGLGHLKKILGKGV